MKTAQQATANWVSAMGNAQTRTNYVNGINSTTVNPMAMAATPEALDAYVNGCQNSVTSGKRANSLNQANVADWKNNATKFGANNLATGAQKSQSKYSRKIAPFAAVWPQMRAAARALPKGGAAAAKARYGAALDVLMSAVPNAA